MLYFNKCTCQKRKKNVTPCYIFLSFTRTGPRARTRSVDEG